MANRPAFDAYADAYDSWFFENRNVLASEVLLVKHALGTPGQTLSVGCGSGLFESILRTDGIVISHGVEPAAGMAEIARKRGLEVRPGTAEAIPYEDASFDTLLLNGVPSYARDLEQAFREACRVIRPGGHVVVLDVPAESSYGLLYQFAARVGTWEEASLRKVAPLHPYPIEFAAAAKWKTTPEKAELLEKVGFLELEYSQTLTRHPRYSNDAVEEPSAGYDRGDYVAIRGKRP